MNKGRTHFNWKEMKRSHKGNANTRNKTFKMLNKHERNGKKMEKEKEEEATKNRRRNTKIL